MQRQLHWLGITGMEHVLFVVFSAAAIFFWFSSAPRHAGLCALSLMLLVLTRPEGLLLLAVLLLFRRHTLRSARQILGCIGAVAIGQSLLFAINWKITHTLMSVTMKGRQWLYFGPEPIGMKGRINFEILSLVRTTLNIWFTRSFARLTVYRASIVLVLIGAAISIWLIVRVHRARHYRLTSLLLWAAVLNGVYLAELPATGHGGRYQPLQLLLLLPFAYIGIYRLLCWTLSRAKWKSLAARPLALPLLAAIMSVSTGYSWITWWRVTAEGIDQINQEHGAMASWLQQHISPADLEENHVAIFDIGRMGYALNGHLTDLGGLLDSGYLPYLFAGDASSYMKMRMVRYVVLASRDHSVGYFGGLMFAHPKSSFRLERLETICFSQGEIASEVVKATQAALPCQTAYAIHFP